MYNTLAHIFREKNFSYAKTCLDTIQHDYDKGKELFLQRVYITSPVDNQDFIDSKFLLSEFENQQDDFRIRVEAPIMGVYSNDIDWLTRISTRIKTNTTTLHKPNTDIKNIIDENSRVVFLKKPSKFNFKITLKNRVNSDFGNWVVNNTDKVKIGKRALQSIQNGGYAHGYYFYCTSEKVLQLLQIMIGGNISKVERVIVDPSIDK